MTLTNDGPELTGVTVVTNLTSPSTNCTSVSSLAANAGQLVCSFVYHVTWADMVAGHLPVFDVTATGNDGANVVLATATAQGMSHLVLKEALTVTVDTSAEACTTPTDGGTSE